MNRIGPRLAKVRAGYCEIENIRLIHEATKVRIGEKVSYCVILQNKRTGSHASAIVDDIAASASETESGIRICGFRLREEC